MIEIKNVSKEYWTSTKKTPFPFFNPKSKITAVNQISLTCHKGRIFTLLGPNGAGKTTTLRMIATIIKPTKGEIHVSGNSVADQPEAVRRSIGFLTGNTGLYDRLTAYELIRYFADLNSLDRDEFEERFDELTHLLEMRDYIHRRIGTLSTGMKQKISIVRTIIHDPDVVIFDEPTSGLDVITSKHIIKLIQDCKNRGKTVIFSTHRMGEVRLLAEDLGIIHQGKLLFNGPLNELLSSSQESFEDQFINMINEGSS